MISPGSAELLNLYEETYLDETKVSEMKVAVVGTGVAGLTAARTLACAGVRVTLYEKEIYIGGHARTISNAGIGLDTGFMVFNRVTPKFPSPCDRVASFGSLTSKLSKTVAIDVRTRHSKVVYSEHPCIARRF